MYYGITLTRSDDLVRNTTENYHMAPSSRPLVNPPSVKDEYVDIPGANGSLDYTEILSGAVHYGMREGSWEFIVLNDPYIIVDRNGSPDNGWWELYHKLLDEIHGKYFKKIELESEPDRVYSGRLFLEDWKTEKENSKVTIKYKINPLAKPKTVEKPNPDPTPGAQDIEVKVTEPWLWNSLFGDYKIIFGPFRVDGDTYRTIINSESTAQSITLECDTAMTLKKNVVFNYDQNGVISSIDESNAETVELPVGNTTISIPSGENVFKFTGHGKVEVYYGVTGAGV